MLLNFQHFRRGGRVKYTFAHECAKSFSVKIWTDSADSASPAEGYSLYSRLEALFHVVLLKHVDNANIVHHRCRISGTPNAARQCPRKPVAQAIAVRSNAVASLSAASSAWEIRSDQIRSANQVRSLTPPPEKTTHAIGDLI